MIKPTFNLVHVDGVEEPETWADAEVEEEEDEEAVEEELQKKTEMNSKYDLSLPLAFVPVIRLSRRR